MGNWCLIAKDWEWDAPVKINGEWGCERTAASLGKSRDLLPKLEGVSDFAWGLIEVKDGLIELPPVVIRTLLHRGCIQGVAVDLDAVIAPGSCSDMLIRTPVQLSWFGYGGGGPAGLEQRSMIHRAK